MSQAVDTARVAQLDAQIHQTENQEFIRLQEHSNWQTHHIQAIETHNHQLEQHIHELNAQNAHLHQLTQNIPAPSISHSLEEKMLEQIHENTLFLHHMIHNQDKVIKNRNTKLNTLQRSFSWQITGPLRAVKTVTSGVGKTAGSLASQVASTALQTHSYINERPKLKNNLMQMTRLNKLYKNK